jgi:NADPH:quinone reductase-like Zn-dependent oxidoreductase
MHDLLVAWQNIEALAKNGRYVLYGLMGGVKAELDMRPILRKCLSVTGTTLRGRPLPYKVSSVVWCGGGQGRAAADERRVCE